MLKNHSRTWHHHNRGQLNVQPAMGVPMLLGSLLYSNVVTSSFLWKVSIIYQSRWHNIPKNTSNVRQRRRPTIGKTEGKLQSNTREIAHIGLFCVPDVRTLRGISLRDVSDKTSEKSIINLKICITSFASHSASADLLEEIEEVSCSFRPCLREDVPLDVPCAILVQNIWSTFEQGLPLPQCAYVWKNMSHKLISFNINTRHNSTPLVQTLGSHPHTIPHGCYKQDSVIDS
jgi:hypothetical protein